MGGKNIRHLLAQASSDVIKKIKESPETALSFRLTSQASRPIGFLASAVHNFLRDFGLPAGSHQAAMAYVINDIAQKTTRRIVITKEKEILLANDEIQIKKKSHDFVGGEALIKTLFAGAQGGVSYRISIKPEPQEPAPDAAHTQRSTRPHNCGLNRERHRYQQNTAALR